MTRQEFDNSRDGDMIRLTCENHPTLQWSCKKMALSQYPDGKFRYNGRRNIFFASEYPAEECACRASSLYAIIEES